MNFLEIFFWLCLALVVYTYLGYGIILVFLVKFREWIRPPRTFPDPDPWPAVTLFITAYNEELVVDEKMHNCRALDYPADNLTILWVTDGSSDRTNELLRAYPEVRVLFDPLRQGKTAAMNRGMQSVQTPFVVFTDANTLLNPEALKEIVRAFSDPKVGCVSGEKRVAAAQQDNAASGEGLYWKYESFLKRMDGRLKGVTGAAGELFALRTALFEPVSRDTLLDDFVMSLRVVLRGYKTAYCATAFASETASANIREEEKRKVRIAAGGLQSVARLTPLLNPFRFGLFSWQYLSHRVLRWTLTPVALFLLLPLNVMLVAMQPVGWLYPALLCAQVFFYSVAFLGRVLRDKHIRIKGLFVPYYFLFMNYSVFRGVGYLWRKKSDGTWERAARKAAQN